MKQIRIFARLLSAAVLVQPLLAMPIFWFLPWTFPTTSTTTSSSTSSGSTSSSSASTGNSSSSNVSIGIGNRVNTTTGLDDYGTNISNVQINVNRMRRSIAEQTIVDASRQGGPSGLGGSVITIGEHTIRLPANVSNVTINTYLVNGIPIDEQSMTALTQPNMETSVNFNSDETNPLLTAVRIFKSFLSTVFNSQAQGSEVYPIPG